MKINFLNVGKTRYGDCIVIQNGSTTVLVDGAHPGDERKKEGLPRSIPEQLESLLGPAPHKISLLIVTHCHLDHIGCLPALVEHGLLQIEDALVADEKMGFGHVAAPDGTAAPDTANGPPEVRRVVAALREEPRGINETDDELEAFLDAADNLESNYDGMLARLEAAGTKVIRYTGQPLTALEKKYRALNFHVLGPAKEHLLVCAEAIAGYQNDALQIVAGLAQDASQAGAVSLYRAVLQSGLSDAEDRPGKGAALNNQSIVFTIATGAKKILLVGDMQFAKPEISELRAPMKKLRADVRAAGPFALVKTAHHTSYNGVDPSVLADFPGKPLLVHSGGYSDGGHPDVTALQTLRNASTIGGFARTDHNGMISCDFAETPTKITIERGDLNDFTPNTEDPIHFEPVSSPAIPEVLPPPPAPVVPAAQPPGLAPTVQMTTRDDIEVILRLPRDAVKVTLTVQVEPTGSGPGPTVDIKQAAATQPRISPKPLDLIVAAGRKLPKLLFVTSAGALARKIGGPAASGMLATLRGMGFSVLDAIPDGQVAPEGALALVKQELRRQSYAGVVLVGGYDVVPSTSLLAVDADLKSQLPSPTGDSDNFVVWSDAEYGDSDGDGMPELPVSRVPDGGSAEFLATVLAGRPVASGSTAFGVRNRARPFADGVFQTLCSPSPLMRSEPAAPAEVQPAALQADYLYFMLHGSDRDGTRFWGEDDEGACEALNQGCLPAGLTGIVFTGCCWGGLIVEQPALYQHPDQAPRPRDVGSSLALSFLKAGARAFIGCTGSHYSPTVAPYNYFGGPLHLAFWREIVAGRAPAEALFNAKKTFLQGMPHGRSHAVELAIEMKLYHQYTCLGLGW